MSEPTLPKDTLGQQLSAFIDGELPGAEAELLVRRLIRDTELKQSMNRYLLIGEALRLPGVSGPSRDFSTKIAAFIEQDSPKPVAVNLKDKMLSWLQPTAGIAIAASVAAVTIFVFHVVKETVHAPIQTPVARAQSSEAHSYVVPEITHEAVAPIPAARLTHYLVAHSEYSSPLGRRNMLTGLLATDETTQATNPTAPVESVPTVERP